MAVGREDRRGDGLVAMRGICGGLAGLVVWGRRVQCRVEDQSEDVVATGYGKEVHGKDLKEIVG